MTKSNRKEETPKKREENVEAQIDETGLRVLKIRTSLVAGRQLPIELVWPY